MRIVQAVLGTFHHFDLARELEARGYLERIYSGFPWQRLKREGLNRDRVRTFPWLQVPLFLSQRYLGLPRRLENYALYRSHVFFDHWVASQIEDCDALVALSGSGLKAGALVQRRGGRFVVDRGSSHIRCQYALVTEEYRRWGLDLKAWDDRMIAREEAEYALADAITVPSEFARRSFLEMGVPAQKVTKVPYGVRLDRFRPLSRPRADTFEVLFAGSVSLRKGFPYLIQAFQMLRHPGKRLRLAGPIAAVAKQVLERLDLADVELLGAVPQEKLVEYMSASHVLVLPSIEEGLALVQAQAMACGCPLISSVHAGGEDLFTDGVEGFLVPIRSADAIYQRLDQLATDPELRQRMSDAALLRVQTLGGWTAYGEKYSSFLRDLTGQ